MRRNPDLQPLGVRESAIKLLERYGLEPTPSENDEHDFDRWIETLEAKQEAYAQGDAEIYYSAEPKDFLSPTELEALGTQ